MSATFIVSLCGITRSGLLQDIAQFTHEHGGTWKSSKVSHLEGHIAAIIKVEIPEEKVGLLKEQFTAQSELSVQFDEVNKAAEASATSLNLVVDANDRPGLVKEITNVLDGQDVTLVDMESYRVGATGIGKSLFTANMKLRLPVGCDSKEVMAELEELSGDIVVKVANE